MKDYPRENNLTIIELLVIVAIIGILVAIVMPHYTEYTKQAVDNQMNADLENAARAMEKCHADDGTLAAGKSAATYTGCTKAVLLASFGYHESPPVVTTITLAADGQSYTLQAVASGGTAPSRTFDSIAGKTTPGVLATP